MNLVRITAPTGPVVSLEELKAYLRVDGTHEDALITALEKAAVAKLDGYRGILGRCILPQTWEAVFDKAGKFPMPLTDIVNISAVDADDVPVTFSVVHQDVGEWIEVSAPATVRLTAALPDDLLDVVKQAIKMLVAHWYENRETVAEGNMNNVPLAFHALAGVARRVMV